MQFSGLYGLNRIFYQSFAENKKGKGFLSSGVQVLRTAVCTVSQASKAVNADSKADGTTGTESLGPSISTGERKMVLAKGPSNYSYRFLIDP